MSEAQGRWRRAAVRTQALVRMTTLVKRFVHEFLYAGHSKPVVVVCIHKRTLYSASHDSTCRSWDLTTHACNGVFSQHTAEVRAMLVFTHEDHDYLVSGSADTTICVWKDCDASKPPLVLKRHNEAVHRLCRFYGWIFSGSHDKTVIQWRIEDGVCLRVFNSHTAPVMGILVTENGLLVSCGGDCKLKVWSLDDDNYQDSLPVVTDKCETLTGHNAIVESLTHIEPDVVFSGDTKGRIIQWSLETNSVVREYQGHKGGISCLAVALIPADNNPEGAIVLVSGSSDATIRIWDIDTGETMKVLEVHTAGIACLKVFYTASYDCPLMFTGGSDNMIACCLLSPALGFPKLASFPGHKQAVRDVALLDLEDTGSNPAMSSSSTDRPQGPILFSASDDASIRSNELRLQRHELVLPQQEPSPPSNVNIATSSESSEVVDGSVNVALPSEPTQPDHVAKPILEWTTGLVMNSASGTWPNNIQGLAKLIIDGVQLLAHPLAIIEANRWLHHVFLERTLMDYPAWLQKGEGVVSGLQLLTDPLDVIINIASSVMRLSEVEVGGFENVHPNLVRFWAAAAVVCLQAVFLFANTRTAILWKLRQHALDPNAGEKLKSVRRIPRVLCDTILVVVMWGPATVLFMPITEALLNAVSGELHDTEALPLHAFLGAILLGLYLLTVSRLTCLQGKIEYMDSSSVYFGNDSLEEAMQDSHMFSVRSIWYLRSLFVLQTFYLIVGVFANRLSPILGLSLLLAIACGIFGLTCITPPYYHDSVNATFVVFTAIVMWSNVVSLLTALDPRSQVLDAPSGVHHWLPTALPWEALLLPLVGAALLVFHLVRQYFQGWDIFKWFRAVVKTHDDTTYFPLIAVLRVPDLEAVLVVLAQLAHETRGRAEREKLVGQGAIPALVVCLKYLGKLRSAIDRADKQIKATQHSSRLTQQLTRFYCKARLRLLHGVRIEDRAAVFGASESAIRALGNLLINGMQTGALPQAQSAGAFSLFLAELYAAAKAMHRPDCSHPDILQSCRWAKVGREVPFEPKLAQFATVCIMNSAGPEALGAWLVSQGTVEIVHSILACAASQGPAAQERLLQDNTWEMAITQETVDYACRIMSQLGLSNKHDPDIKLKIIKTGITKPLMTLASVANNAPKPSLDWAFRAVLAIANLCDDTNDHDMRTQLSIKMVQEGVLDPLFLHLTSTHEHFQLRALDGLCTISDTIALRSSLASHLAATAAELTQMIESNAKEDVKQKIVQLLKSVFALDVMQNAPRAFHPRMLQDYATEDIRRLWLVAQPLARAHTIATARPQRRPTINGVPFHPISIQRSNSMRSDDGSIYFPPPAPSSSVSAEIGGGGLVRTHRVSAKAPKVQSPARRGVGNAGSNPLRSSATMPMPMPSRSPQPLFASPAIVSLPSVEFASTEEDVHEGISADGPPHTVEVPMVIQEQQSHDTNADAEIEAPTTAMKRKLPDPAADDEAAAIVTSKRTRSGRNTTITTTTTTSPPRQEEDGSMPAPRVTRRMSQRKRTFSERK